MELATGTYSGSLAKTSCSYQTVTINIPCTSKEHHMPGQSCDMTGDNAPKSFTMVALVCGADTSLGDDGEPGGGMSIGETGGLGSGNPDEIPTMPNLPTIKATSCQRLQALITNGIFKGNATTLFGNINFSSETGYTMGTPIPGQSNPTQSIFRISSGV